MLLALYQWPIYSKFIKFGQFRTSNISAFKISKGFLLSGYIAFAIKSGDF